ncbi:integral membrane protein [Xylaria venustula]|nr:integral membrane protein [Xylaria venustula]
MLSVSNLAANRRLLSFLLSFAFIYSIAAFYLQQTCYHDPSSIFWRPEKALRLSYSAIRKNEAREFSDQAVRVEQVKWDNVTAPQLCIGVASVNRHGYSYLRETLGSLLEGLDELERKHIYLVVFLAHSDQTKHEDSTAPWLRNMADSLPAYPDDHELLELLQALETDDSYPSHARKQKIDYSVLLDECAKVQPAYTVTLEDDVIALDGWFHRTLSALRTAVRKTEELGRDQFLYLRLFYDSRLLGWNSEEWPYYAGFSAFFVLGSLAVILCLRKRFQTIHEATPVEVLVTLCGVCAPMMIVLFFAAGRSCMLPKEPGVGLMQMYGCCGQGLVFPQKQVTDHLLPLFRNTIDSHAAVDTFLEDYANEKDELRWAVTPNLIQHVGGKSSHGVGDQVQGRITSNMPFNYDFETNDPAELTHEHLAWIEELKSGLPSENPRNGRRI